MSNHMTRTWDHRESKSLDPKLLPLGHHLDGLLSDILLLTEEAEAVLKRWEKKMIDKRFFFLGLYYGLLP